MSFATFPFCFYSPIFSASLLNRVNCTGLGVPFPCGGLMSPSRAFLECYGDSVGQIRQPVVSDSQPPDPFDAASHLFMFTRCQRYARKGGRLTGCHKSSLVLSAPAFLSAPSPAAARRLRSVRRASGSCPQGFPSCMPSARLPPRSAS